MPTKIDWKQIPTTIQTWYINDQMENEQLQHGVWSMEYNAWIDEWMNELISTICGYIFTKTKLSN